MNEKAITKFLAEQMGWHIEHRTFALVEEVTVIEETADFWMDSMNERVMKVHEFDPLHNPKHALMLVPMVLGDESEITEFKLTLQDGYWYAIFLSFGTLKQYGWYEDKDIALSISFASVRTLATNDQIKEFGL